VIDFADHACLADRDRSAAELAKIANDLFL
jgi:hypothetical protein